MQHRGTQHLVAVWLWANYLTSLDLSLLVYAVVKSTHQDTHLSSVLSVPQAPPWPAELGRRGGSNTWGHSADVVKALGRLWGQVPGEVLCPELGLG